MRRIPDNVVQQMKEMRSKGISILIIGKELGYPKSSVSKYVRDIVLTESMKENLKQRRSSMIHQFGNGIYGPLSKYTKEERSFIAKKSAEKRKENNPNYMDAPVRSSALSYLPHELEIKKILEQEYNCSFQKEIMDFGKGFVAFDFANNQYLIEHTVDWGKGLSRVIKRFDVAESMGDIRTRIAYLNTIHLGKKRMKKLSDLNVIVYDESILNS